MEAMATAASHNTTPNGCALQKEIAPLRKASAFSSSKRNKTTTTPATMPERTPSKIKL